MGKVAYEPEKPGGEVSVLGVRTVCWGGKSEENQSAGSRKFKDSRFGGLV